MKGTISATVESILQDPEKRQAFRDALLQSKDTFRVGNEIYRIKTAEHPVDTQRTRSRNMTREELKREVRRAEASLRDAQVLQGADTESKAKLVMWAEARLAAAMARLGSAVRDK